MDKDHTMEIDHDNQEPAVMLGFAEPIDLEENGPLTAQDFPSKIGGLPIWLNPEHIPESKDLTCGLCKQPMAFLLQLYSPEDHPAEAFHRMIYVFCCKTGTCHRLAPSDSFKVFRSQLGRFNPYYSPTANDDDPEEADVEEDPNWKPLESSKHAKTCFVCGLNAPKKCSKCREFFYCSEDHQMLHWTKGLHKTLCGKKPLNLDTKLASLSLLEKDVKKHHGDDENEDEDEEMEQPQIAPEDELTKEEKEYAGRLKIDFRLVERVARFPEFEVISEEEVVDEKAKEDGYDHESSGDEQEAEDGWEEKLKARRKKKTKGSGNKDDDVSDDLKGATNALVPVGDELYENTQTDIDRAFLTFQKRIALFPDQVLRYARVEYELENPEPLYVSDIGTPKPEDILPCPHCHKERSFEFQILPQLLNYMAIDHSRADALDFGTVLVYSCKDNCHVKGKHYLDELAIVQQFSEDGMQGKNMYTSDNVAVSPAK
ncbi:Programmed cell death protein 2 [Actinomortierella ambigua]|uniref:Programmed cell death protein 2 n=1 Tax=Actinomortierella ambigua TaxID=1343610 RepID=A0A9P6Q9H1_9FUNG|nr:Programmed cell death protein 2 [Actinomortierella ambigua]